MTMHLKQTLHPPRLRPLLLRAAMWLALVLPAQAARGVIGVGQPAPAIHAEDMAGKAQVWDARSTTPLVLVFAKPEDKYTSEALAAFAEMTRQTPELARGARRYVVFSRIRPEDKLERPKAILAAHPGWTGLLDRDDTLYEAYVIVATPTVVLVGGDHKVAATHPGFDPGFEQDVRVKLAALLGVKLPEMATGTPAPPDMRLEMARSLAGRGLYDRALPYYLKAQEAGALTREAGIELADVYLSLGQLDKAQPLLDDAPTSGPLAAQAKKVAERLAALRAGKPDPGHNPRIRIRPDAPLPSTATQSR